MNQTFHIILITVAIIILVASGFLVWRRWPREKKEVEVPEEGVPEEGVVEEEPEKTVNPWDVFQGFLETLKTRDLDKINTLVYKPLEPEEWEAFGMTKDEYLELTESFYKGVIGELQEPDFVNVEEDERQIVMFTDLISIGEKDYSKSCLYFVKNPEREILFLVASRESWANISPTELKDTDRDGLIDRDENCLGAKQYDPACVKTDPNLKDTDGDGWWDSIELEAETNPNNPTRHPYGSANL